jgi:hypothetical protein
VIVQENLAVVGTTLEDLQNRELRGGVFQRHYVTHYRHNRPDFDLEQGEVLVRYPRPEVSRRDEILERVHVNSRLFLVESLADKRHRTLGISVIMPPQETGGTLGIRPETQHGGQLLVERSDAKCNRGARTIQGFQRGIGLWRKPGAKDVDDSADSVYIESSGTLLVQAGTLHV